ncbi:MAG: UbiA family prenyltransferase [Candidatus Aminicenantes bacterium]|nr:MAG: UbiA family prenyltransferase [Candidatus Aminicenantes bacterium]
MEAINRKQYAGILSLVFWKAFWSTMRPYLIFVSGASGLVGLAFIDIPKIERAVMAFIPLLLSYGLGQALTDCFQTDTDALSSPYRPLIQGIISRGQVFAISLTGLVFGILLLTYLNPYIFLLGLLAVFGLLSYTALKRTWWGGPFWNSWIVALLPIIGRAAERGFDIRWILSFEDSQTKAFLFAVVAIFFAYGNFVVMGYLKDISADKKTGYRTFSVVFGWKATAVYSDLLAFLAAFFSGLALYTIGNLSIISSGIFCAAIINNLYAQIKIHRTREETKAYGPISYVVRSFILYCAAIVLSLKLEWIVFMAIFYVTFEVALKYRPEKTQV